MASILWRFTAAIFFLSSVSVSAKKCKPVDFGKGSVVCECNSTYCDTYADPQPPNEGEFIWFITSKSGKRLNFSTGKISNVQGNGYTIRIDSKKQYQTIEGFGGAFTDAAGINIKKLSQGAQDNLMKSYFSIDGSKYNIGRIPIGGSDFSTRGYTYDDNEGDTKLENFTLATEDFNYKILILQQALHINPSMRFLSAAWTAPPWMKNENEFYGASSLQEKYYQVYANYIVKFLEEYKKNGIDIWALSTGNEPFSALRPTFIKRINSMYWSPRAASKWIVENLGPTLQQSQFNQTNILLLDDQRSCLPWYVAYVKVFQEEVLKYVKGIAVHWYVDGLTPAIVLDITHDLIPNKFILMTESSIGGAPWVKEKVILGSWLRAEDLITKMFENFNHWVVGWVDWNLALDDKGGPTWLQNEIDSSIIVVPNKDIFYKQPTYYAMAHFSKFVPRSSVRIENYSEDKNILSTAFKTKDNTIIVLLYNKDNKSKNVTVVDEKIGNIHVTLPEYSLHTFLYKGL